MTIRDIANEAGVSVATVSRLINNKKILTKNAQKIQSIIDKTNYHPNSIAQSLKSNSTRTIGFLVSDISNDYFIALCKNIEDNISKKKYNIIVCSTDTQAERELEYLKMLVSKKVDAIILNPTSLNNDYVAKISREIPMVLLHRRNNSPLFRGDFIDCDNYRGCYMLTEHLLSLGHRKIGCVSGPAMFSNVTERLHGFDDALKKYGVHRKDNPYVVFTDFTYEEGYSAAARLFSGKDRPTAIITLNNTTTLGILKYFKDRNIKVPQECSVACFGAIYRSDLYYIQPSYVTLDEKEIGTMLAEAALSRIENTETENRDFIYKPSLVIGNAEKRIAKDKNQGDNDKQ